jgi:twitching motility protein PilT
MNTTSLTSFQNFNPSDENSQIANIHHTSTPKQFNTIEQMVKHAHSLNASDIHIRVGEIPRYRVRGQMMMLENHIIITAQIFQNYLNEILSPLQINKFIDNQDLDAALLYPGLVRVRINCFEALNGGAMVLRLIPLRVPSIDQLELPAILKSMIVEPQGLILVTGPTGSGKSTTLAAMIRHLNETEAKHIISIEDPIEYVHNSYRSLITQREIGLHTHDFQQALKSVLREDPDVILIGEMRDRLTVNIALQAAQTGHLVLGTLHTASAVQAINRLLNLYNPDEQNMMRVQISQSLLAIIAQLLIPTTDNKRTAVHEILVNSPAVQDYLLKGEDDQVTLLMETDSMNGMQIMNNALYSQILQGRITIDSAMTVSPDPYDLDRRLRTGGFDQHRSSRDF